MKQNGSGIHVDVVDARDLEDHLGHAADRNAIAAGREEQNLLLKVDRHLRDHAPEVPIEHASVGLDGRFGPFLFPARPLL